MQRGKNEGQLQARPMRRSDVSVHPVRWRGDGDGMAMAYYGLRLVTDTDTADTPFATSITGINPIA